MAKDSLMTWTNWFLLGGFCALVFLAVVVFQLAGVLLHMDTKLSEIHEMYYQEQKRLTKGSSGPEVEGNLWITFDPSPGIDDLRVLGAQTFYSLDEIDSLRVIVSSEPPLGPGHLWDKHPTFQGTYEELIEHHANETAPRQASPTD